APLGARVSGGGGPRFVGPAPPCARPPPPPGSFPPPPGGVGGPPPPPAPPPATVVGGRQRNFDLGLRPPWIQSLARPVRVTSADRRTHRALPARARGCGPLVRADARCRRPQYLCCAQRRGEA